MSKGASAVASGRKFFTPGSPLANLSSLATPPPNPARLLFSWYARRSVMLADEMVSYKP